MDHAAFTRIVVPGLVAIATLTPAVVDAQQSCPSGFSSRAFELTEAPETFVLPAGSSTLIVRAIGAGGGEGHSGDIRPGGGGALIQGTFPVSGGETLQILVGGAGEDAGANLGGGGGGASYVGIGATLAGSTPLVIAGGGGGGGRGDNAIGGDGGVPGATGPPVGTAGGHGGTDGGEGGAGDLDPDVAGEPGGLGGVAGNGGAGTSGCDTGGGAGLETDGGLGATVVAAVALRNGGAAGTGPWRSGGFGGGGAAGSCGGGGGGYSGGGGGGDGDFGNATQGAGGGGGSFNAGADPLEIAGFQPSGTDGLVEICFDEVVGALEIPVLDHTGLLVLAGLLLAFGLVAVRRLG